MSVSSSSLEYLWIEAVPLCREVASELGLEANAEAEIRHRIEKHGFRVGAGLAHVVMRDETHFLESQIDIVKFMCNELWILLFHKQVNNLKTNHHNIYFIIDHKFAMCQRMSTNLSPDETVALAAPYLWFPCGIIRGFLHGMGIESRVAFQATELPSVAFEITICT